MTLWEKRSWRAVWDTISVVLVLYNLLVIPVRIGFSGRVGWTCFEGTSTIVLVLDYTVDLFFWVDLILYSCPCWHLRQSSDKANRGRPTRASSASLSMLMTSAAADSAYEAGGSRPCRDTICSTRVWLSVVATLPLELFALLGGLDLILFRINRMFRIVQFSSRLWAVDDMLEAVYITVGYRRMAKLFCTMALQGHVMGCFLHGIAVWRATNEACAPGDTCTWAEQDDLWSVHSHANGSITIDYAREDDYRYIRAYYWAIITSVTTGFGDIVPKGTYETLLTIVTMYTGVLTTASVIGMATTLVSSLDGAMAEHQNKLDRLSKYMRHRDLPDELQQQIRDYYEYFWSLLKGMNEASFLRELPPPIRRQITGAMTNELIQRVDIFHGVSRSVCNAIAGALELQIYSPAAWVVREKSKLSGLYLLSSGEAYKVYREIRVDILQRGSFFGSLNLIFPDATKEGVRAKSYCEFFHMSQHAYTNLTMSHFSEVDTAMIRTKAEKLSKQKIKANKFFGAEDNFVNPTGWAKRFLPGTTFRMAWDGICIFGIAYQSFVIPVQIAYTFKEFSWTPGAVVLLTIAYLIDVFFIVDIVLCARFFGYMQDGEILSYLTCALLLLAAGE